MSRFDDLITEYCPDGVTFESLGTLVKPSTNIKWPDNSDGEFEYIDLTSVDRVTHTISGTEAITRKTAPDRAKQVVHTGDVIFGTTRPMLKRYCTIPAEFDGQIASTGYCVLRPDSDRLLSRFLFHVLGTARFYEFVEANERGASYPAISNGVVKKFRMPVPPLEVQQEIAQVLDQFAQYQAQLEADLSAELEARRSQYEHIAHALLESGDDIPHVRLGDVTTIVRGASPRPIQTYITTSDDGVPWIKIGDVPVGSKYITDTAQRITPAGASKSRRVRPGDFVLSNSMSFGRPYISKIDGYIHDGWLAISDFDESFVPDYLYYLLRSSPVQAEFARRAGAGTVKNLNADIVKAVTVPVPPREKQVQVVELLDRFEAIVHELISSLHAELAARRKQYEYYRERLMTFEEVAA